MKPVRFGEWDITRYLQSHGVAVDGVRGVRRNSTGTALYIYPSTESSNAFPVLKVTTNGVIKLADFPLGGIPGSNDEPVAWFPEGANAVAFRGSRTIFLSNVAHVGVDPGGDYFVIDDAPNKTCLGRVGDPESGIELPKDFLPARVFASGGRIYVSGHTRQTGNGNLLATCLILSDNGRSFSISERLYFDWSAGITDVDPVGGKLLLWDKALVTHSVYLYDLTTRQRTKLGRVIGYEFFLRDDILNERPTGADEASRSGSLESRGRLADLNQLATWNLIWC